MPHFAIAPASLHRLRRRLSDRDPAAAAELLREAGVASGEALAGRWRNRVAERTGLDDAHRLDLRWFGPLLDELCVGLGWGSLSATALGDRALLLEAGDWAEAEPDSADGPACHFSCGCFAAFLSAQVTTPIEVVEVECRSHGAEACRFLAASPSTLATVNDLVAAGRSWREAFSADELPD